MNDNNSYNRKMVKEINKNQKSDTASSATIANAASLMYNQQNASDMNFQNQQQILATVLMFPSLFMPQTVNSAASSQLNLQPSISNNNPSIDQLIQQQLISNNNGNNLEQNYLNETLLATLAGNLMQQQKSQQEHAAEMTASNNVWAKLLTDMSSSLAGSDNNQSNNNQVSTLMLANNGEVSLKPPSKQQQRPTNLESQSKERSNNNKMNAQSNQQNQINNINRKNGEKLNYKPNKINQSETIKQLSNGSASLSSSSSTSSTSSMTQKSSKPNQSSTSNSSFSIKDLIDNNSSESSKQMNNKKLNSVNHNYSPQQIKSVNINTPVATSNLKSQQSTGKQNINKPKPNLGNNNNNNTNSSISQIGNLSQINSLDLNNQNEALMMYAAMLQNNSNNDNVVPSIPFNFFSNSSPSMSFDWLFQLAHGQQIPQINSQLVNNLQSQGNNPSNGQKNAKPNKQVNNKLNRNEMTNQPLSILTIDSLISNNTDTSNRLNESKIKTASMSQNKNLNTINNNNPEQNNSSQKMNNKQKSNFISNMEDQNNEPIEAKIKIPLKYGWRRETIIKEVHKNGVKGDVIYYSPCSKKLRTFQEIERYLSRNTKELDEKGIKLSRDNFTFSSKIIVGKFLQSKQCVSGDESVSSFDNKTNDDYSDDKLENELKFSILNEEDIITMISNLNPKFRPTSQTTQKTDFDGINQDDYLVNGKQISPNENSYEPTYNDLELKLKIESLKLLKKEQENQSRSQQAQMLEMQRLEQQQHEQNLKLKFQSNSNEINLQLDLKKQQEQILIQNRLNQQEKQNQIKNSIIEAKRREKYLQRERKTREKWFEHIISREQQTSKQQQIVEAGNDKPQIIFDSIDDMQEKYLKKMPDFKQLHIEPILEVKKEENSENEDEEKPVEPVKLNWVGDCLQVIEFVNTFGPKLTESLNKAKSSATQSDSQNNYETHDTSQFSSILGNLETFRSGLENKNDKLKREIGQLVQLLLKCAINTLSDRNINLNESVNKSLDIKEDEDADIEDNEIKQDLNNNADVKNNIKLVDEDDYYYVKRLKQLEANDLTYSELLRLYIKRSLHHLKQRRELTVNKFNIDITLDLFESLKLYLYNLEAKTFDQLETPIKANIMAWLCDELLSTSSIGDSNETYNQDDYRTASCVVQDLDQTIEELNELKHEKWQLESKCRQTKTEKLTATVGLNKLLNKKPDIPVQNNRSEENISEETNEVANKTENTLNDSFNLKEKEKQQKLIQQIDKKLTQIDKKRIQVKQTHDKCLNKLRSGIHLGQDRYLRHYWSLNHVGGVLIEAASRASIGSIYLSEESTLLMPDDELKLEAKIEAKIEEEEIKMEIETGKSVEIKSDDEENTVIQNYSYLIERLSMDDPFKFTLKFNNDEIISLTFRHIEYLVRNEIQQKIPEKIDKKYLNCKESNSIVLKNTSSKWWLCDNELIFKQLIDCLSKRGYREKALAKCLSKLNEDNFTNSNSSVVLTDHIATTGDPVNNEICNNNSSFFNRISNNLGNLQMFEKTNNFLKDFVSNNEQPSGQINHRFLNQLKQQEYREKAKVLKQMYALEDRVFKANLQQPMEKSTEQCAQNNNDNESPLDIAKSRLLELEARIERRYLKYPFVPRKKLSNIKLSNIQQENDTKDAITDYEIDDNEYKEENQELPTLLSLSYEPNHRKNKAENCKITKQAVPLELERWRRLVKNCKTSSQLAILITELNKLIEWEKSIMKVICQICNCDDNEDKLLLCDNCDKGNHTYCFKPVLDQIPEGDWYCFVCIAKLNGDNICCVCGSNSLFCPYSETDASNPNSDMNKCDKCSKCFHGQCMPYARYFKTSHKWHCLNCQNIKPPVSAADAAENIDSTNNNNKRNLSAIHNLNKVSTNKKKKAADSASNNEVSNSDDCSTSQIETISFRKKPKKKFGFTKGKNLNTNPTNTDLDESSSKKEKKNSKRKRSLSNENSADDDIENNENECEENDDEEEETESGKDNTLNNSTENESKNKTSKKKRKKRGRLTLVSKKSRRSDTEKKPATKNETSAKSSNAYLSLSSGPNGNPNRDKDLAICSNLLNDMAKNESSWPFAEKVDEKSYPDYYELVKEPMDIQTIRMKLKNKDYENKEQFAYDCRLIFDNCEYFNEDDSAIGKAGHKLRAFFETKWFKLFD